MAFDAWPPTLADLKIDMQKDEDDTRDDEALEPMLAAAVAFIEGQHDETYDFAGESGSTLPAPDVDLMVGTCRLAWRWHTRRRSPDALIQMGELGSGRVPSFDPDIDRLCRLGRFAPPVIA
jgi:hypothetical protein